MDWLFGKKLTPAEQMREQQKELRKATRGVERSRTDLERQEKQLELEIKKAAKAGDRATATVLAKQMVNLRKQKTRTFAAQSQITAVGTKARTIGANQKLGEAMGTTAKVLGQMNKAMPTAQVAGVMQEFSKQSAMMDMKEELIDETLNDILDASDDEAEQDAIVNQVLDEIGIQITGKLAEAPSAPSGSIATKSATATKGITDSDLEAQLARLKASTGDLE